MGRVRVISLLKMFPSWYTWLRRLGNLLILSNLLITQMKKLRQRMTCPTDMLLGERTEIRMQNSLVPGILFFLLLTPRVLLLWLFLLFPITKWPIFRPCIWERTRAKKGKQNKQELELKLFDWTVCFPLCHWVLESCTSEVSVAPLSLASCTPWPSEVSSINCLPLSPHRWPRWSHWDNCSPWLGSWFGTRRLQSHSTGRVLVRAWSPCPSQEEGSTRW